MTTIIRNGLAIGWVDGGFRIIENGCVVYDGDTITYVGPEAEQGADTEIDATGRLAEGCKADIVLIRIDTPKAAPMYDPFKYLVLAADGGDVDTVIVNGRIVVREREVQTIDVPEAVRELNDAARRVWKRLDL
jgi:cytosine/adenosine deaminase-related metal-dependent hydrolase